jgi:hypothetical protein
VAHFVTLRCICDRTEARLLKIEMQFEREFVKAGGLLIAVARLFL